MGNFPFALNMFYDPNKDNNRSSFQSILPFTNANAHNKTNHKSSQQSNKRKLPFHKSNKTSPHPLHAPSGERNESRPASFVADAKQTGIDDEKLLLVGESDLLMSYEHTESQMRRERMADCEFECSEVLEYLFVSGCYVAGDRELLRQRGITHIINCSSGIVKNHFVDDKYLKYLSLNMVDGRDDDISWFLCEAIHFITKARSVSGKVLIHCEKGISRSCSFAIAYCMWSTGKGFGSCFDYVKSRRKVCSPNTAFTCHLLELAELLAKDNVVVGNLMFRCAYHLPHDATTPCLKLCRNNETRKIIKPMLSLFSPNAVYVIRVVWGNGSQQEVVPNSVYAFEAETIYIWSGTSSTPSTTNHAMVLAKYMHGVFTTTENIQLISQGSEPREFLEALKMDESEQSLASGNNSMVATPLRWVEDYFDFPPSQEEIQLSCSRVAADRSNTFFDEGRKGRSSASKGVEGDQRREREPHARPHEESPLIEEDADPCTSLRPPRMPSIRMNSNNSTDDSLRYSRTNSISFSIIADSSNPSSVPSSRKNSNYNVSSAATDGDKTIIAVAPNQSVPIPSESFVEEFVLTSCDSAVLIIETPSLVIAPIALQSAHIKSLLDFDNSDNYYISPESSSACSSSLPHYPYKRRFSREDKDNDDPDDRIQADTIVPTSVSKGSSVAEAELDVSTKGEAMDAPPVKGIAMDAPPVKGIAMDADVDVDMSPTKEISIHSSPVGVDITPPTLSKTGSDNSIRPSSAVSRPSSGASKQSSGIFGNRSNKVAPLNMSSLDAAALCPSDNNTGRSSISSSNIATDRTNTGMDGPNDKSSSSTRSGNNSSRGGGIIGLLKIPGRSLSPVLSLAGLSGTSSATKLNTTQHMNLQQQQQPTQDHSCHSINIGGGSSSSLTLPLPERRGTPVEREKHPENVSLSRAPTPVEDLTPVKAIVEVGSGSDGILSPSEVIPSGCIRSSSSQYLPASTIPVAESFSKPLLFQAIPCRKSRLFDVESKLSKKLTAAVEQHEWQAMGVYDDEDLDKASLFLLLCPDLRHFIWVGPEFPFSEVGLDVALEDDLTVAAECADAIVQWSAGVLKGEVKAAELIGPALVANRDVTVVTAGAESEEFLQAFSDGY